jgi:hypothetical protein
MTAQQLRERLYREPFQPFRLRLSDHRSFDILYPHLNLVGESVLIVGIPPADVSHPTFSDHQVWVPLNSIAALETLPEQPTPAAP